MANISIQEAQGQFTKALLAIYKERIPPSSFLRSFFPSAPPTSSKEVSIMVQRGKEKIAVDCARGSEGRRHTWSKSSEKIFEPVYFRLNFELTSMQFYDRFWGSSKDGSISDAMLAQLANSTVENLLELQETIERSIEVMCSQILHTGKVTMSAQGTGIEIDFKRDALSIVDPGGGNYWSDNVDLFKQIETGCKRLRTKGKMQGMTVNAILGEKAFTDMQNNTKFIARQNMFHYQPDHVLDPQKVATGAVFHGWIYCNSYMVNLWSYPEYYDDIVTGQPTPYIDTNTCILLPQNPKFLTAFGAPPQVLEPGAAPKVGQFIFSDFMAPDKRSHQYDVESCPLPVPVGIDQIYTLKTGVGA